MTRSLLIFGAASLLLAASARGQACDASSFPLNFTGIQAGNLHEASGATDPDSCRQACCTAGASCKLWQWNAHTKCWIGDPRGKLQGHGDFISFGRGIPPFPGPTPPFVPTPPPAPTPAPVPTPPPTFAPEPATGYLVDDSTGLGLRWEGVGAISGGGATTKLLMDYKPEVASDILDFLFLPNFGLHLQMLICPF